jgi:pimeloyl-ACP methyl ester carboxylesterase
MSTSSLPNAPSLSRAAAPVSVGVPVRDDLSVHALDWPQGGVPCVLVHGLGDHAHVWAHVAVDVARRRRVIALDLRGHGDSDWDSRGEYDIPALVDDVATATRRLGVGRMVVIGHSLGGEIAMRLAVLCPERVVALVLVDWGPEFSSPGIAHIHAELTDAARTYDTREDYVRRLGDRHPLARHDVVRGFALHGLRARADGQFEPKTDPTVLRLYAGCAASRRADDRVDQLWRLVDATRCPTLVVRGEASSVLSRHVADRLTRALAPRGALATVAAAGHAVMLDNPRAFLGAVMAFLDTQSGATPDA